MSLVWEYFFLSSPSTETALTPLAPTNDIFFNDMTLLCCLFTSSISTVSSSKTGKFQFLHSYLKAPALRNPQPAQACFLGFASVSHLQVMCVPGCWATGRKPPRIWPQPADSTTMKPPVRHWRKSNLRYDTDVETEWKTLRWLHHSHVDAFRSALIPTCIPLFCCQANKIIEHRRKYQRKREEKEIRDKQERIKKAREEHAKAQKVRVDLEVIDATFVTSYLVAIDMVSLYQTWWLVHPYLLGLFLKK